jgi:DNA-binding NarL/FixJ family response regulator
MQTASSHRVSVVVRHPMPLIARGIVAALSLDAHIDAAEWCGEIRWPDLLLADFETAIGLAADRRRGHAPSRTTKLVAIGTHGRALEVRAALDAGVDGYLLAVCSVAELQACVRTVATGGRHLSDGALRCVVDSLVHEALTPKERIVLRCLWEGMSNKAIARRLQLAISTVKCHVRSILGKLDAGNRTQAIKEALARGLLDESTAARGPFDRFGDRHAQTSSSSTAVSPR